MRDKLTKYLVDHNYPKDTVITCDRCNLAKAEMCPRAYHVGNTGGNCVVAR